MRAVNVNDKRWRIFTCAQKLAHSQLNLPHGTKQKRLMKKLKIKTEMLRRNVPVIKPWSQSRGREGVYGGKDFTEFTDASMPSQTILA